LYIPGNIIVYATSAGSTGADVRRVSNGTQIPAVYSQFFDTAYLDAHPNPAAQPQFGTVTVTPGSLTVSTVSPGTHTISGPALNREIPLPAGGNLPISRLDPGTYRLTMRYPDDRSEERSIAVTAGQTGAAMKGRNTR
jgi:hypothetical protein